MPRGDVTFEASGQAWTLRFGVNALVDLEERTGKPVNEVFAGLDAEVAGRMALFRMVVRIGLSQHHPELTEARVGDLIDDAGGLVFMSGLLAAAIRASFPDDVAETSAPGEALAEA